MNFDITAAAIHIRSAAYTYPARRFVRSYSDILFIVTLPFCGCILLFFSYIFYVKYSFVAEIVFFVIFSFIFFADTVK